MHANLPVRHENEAMRPRLHGFGIEDIHQPAGQGLPAGQPQPEERQAVVCARRKSADVGEIEVLGDEAAAAGLGGLPHIRIRMPGQSLQSHVVHLVAEASERSQERLRQILVEFDPHAGMGAAGTGRSSSAEAAANAMTARTAAGVGWESRPKSLRRWRPRPGWRAPCEPSRGCLLPPALRHTPRSGAQRKKHSPSSWRHFTKSFAGCQPLSACLQVTGRSGSGFQVLNGSVGFASYVLRTFTIAFCPEVPS